MKKILILLLAVTFVILTSCDKSNGTPTPITDEPSATITTPSDDNQTTTTKEEDETANMTLTLKIWNTLVDVLWLDNESVKELKKLAKDGLTIELHQYGGFEQVGSLGSTIKSNDSSITTNAGDICLYQSNQIVFFYGSNTYSYTKLGHINLSKSELVELLDDEDVVTITLKLK